MKKVLLVGNCNFDGPQIKSFIENNFKETNVQDIKTIDESIQILKDKKIDLVLVNRIGDQDQRNGLELVDHLKNKNNPTPIILITNYQEKMDEAIEHGATEGFGKEDLFGDNQEEVKKVLKQVLR